MRMKMRTRMRIREKAAMLRALRKERRAAPELIERKRTPEL